MATVFTAYIGFKGPNAHPDVNRVLLFDLLADSGLNGYTASRSDGYYQGEPEPSIIITVITRTEQEEINDGTALLEVCHRYKELADQEEVWVTRRVEELQVL
jgi:hypothetical protein